MTLTQEQRIAIIKHAVENSQKISPSKSGEDFLEEIKSQETFGEHGLLDVLYYDIEDEMSLIEYKPSAESIDEEEEDLGISQEMKGLYS